MTIQEFAQKVFEVECEGYKRLVAGIGPLRVELMVADCSTTIRPGRKYTKVDVGSSGRYMIENDTGNIYGIKAYGVIHRGHCYGNLAAPKIAERYRS